MSEAKFAKFTANQWCYYNSMIATWKYFMNTCSTQAVLDGSDTLVRIENTEFGLITCVENFHKQSQELKPNTKFTALGAQSLAIQETKICADAKRKSEWCEDSEPRF